MGQLPRMTLNDGMRLRKQVLSSKLIGGHISDTALEAMARQDGLAEVAAQDLDHMADCPACMERWAAQVKKRRKKNEISEAADDWYGGGFLEAAASDTVCTPLTLHSSCGMFCLRLLPEDTAEGKAGKGLITFDLVDVTSHPLAENAWAEVRDANCKMILRGRIVGGRTAMLSERLDEFDLSSWTVVIGSKKNAGD